MTPFDDRPAIHVVEDDASSRHATVRTLRTAGYRVCEYPTAADFLRALPAGAGCVVMDLQMPGPSGLDAQEALSAAPNPLPIVFLTGYGDVGRSVRAMKAGAIDFLTKPVEAHLLLEAVARALDRDRDHRALAGRQAAIRTRYERLTRREREVLAHLISGQLNKQTAFDLGTTEHTIKVHRRRVLEKMEADSVASLVRMAALLDIAPVGTVR